MNKHYKREVLIALDNLEKPSNIAKRLGCSGTLVGYYIKKYRPILLSKRITRVNPDNKYCPKCGAPKYENRAYCQNCTNQYQKERIKKPNNKWKNNRRIETREFIRKIKDVPCMDCQIKYHWFAMDFDHVRGKKVAAVSVGISKGWSQERLSEEIAKCDIICSNCHRIRTYNRKHNDNS